MREGLMSNLIVCFVSKLKLSVLYVRRRRSAWRGNSVRAFRFHVVLAPDRGVFFFNGRCAARWIALKYCVAYRAFLTQREAKKMSGPGQVTGLRRHERYYLFCQRFFIDIVVSATLCGHWLKRRHCIIQVIRGPHLSWPLTLYFDLSKVIWGHWH